MKRILYLLSLCCCFFTTQIDAQITLRGEVLDAGNRDAIIGANIIVEGTSEGTITDWDGSFEFETSTPLPFNLEISYIGYSTKVMQILDDKRLSITISEDAAILTEVEVKASRISDKQKESPLTVESLDLIAIKETPAANFYDGLGSLKGVDLTAASLGFKVVNTRGFNSTSPVRSLQTIDGIDNQAPGLNFSLGNFLGSSELDINKVELIVGASSAFYGPNAFNGVIGMETKDPFYHKGLSAMVKVGERNMLNGAIRWADSAKNKDGNEFFAYKMNFEYLQADDWVADNYGPIDDSEVEAFNPGRFDAVNIYGDEYQNGGDYRELNLSDPNRLQEVFYRTGYREEDLVDYDTKNAKANVALHFRTNPSQKEQSPEIIASTNYGSGTTVYQGDNRFSLKGITFLQNRLEFRKKDKFFVRAYTTRTGAGDSYDPYFTALELQEAAKPNDEWLRDYNTYWVNEIRPQIVESDYPKLSIVTDESGIPIFNDDGTIKTEFDVNAALSWINTNNGLLTEWHTEAAAYSDEGAQGTSNSIPFFVPGTERFDQEFDRITSAYRGQGGTRFFDNSALYHAHGEYKFTPTWADYIKVGSNYRLYTPKSQGTVFSDTSNVTITNSEVGFYAGGQKSFMDNQLKVQATIRADKNQNFNWLVSPAASLVYTPSQNNYLRVSFSSAIRNPTLSDQYLFLDVGRATLSGNINGVEDLVTLESLGDFFDTQLASVLDTFSIAPVRPEAVKTFEVGYRTTLFEKLYVDAGYYYSIYDHFLGFQLGADFDYTTEGGGVTVRELEVYRYAANSTNQVTTQGLAIGLNYYIGKKYAINGNYSWNKLNQTFEDDPVIPAFNTPEHKYNLGFSGRNLTLSLGARRLNNVSFNINYKWIQGFIFEGSPQFTGFIPTYDMVDAQMTFGFPKVNSTLKIGASNLLDNRSFQTFGGPEIGRLAYITYTYEFKKK